MGKLCRGDTLDKKKKSKKTKTRVHARRVSYRVSLKNVMFWYATIEDPPHLNPKLTP
jgi:hypothetical protein